MPLTRLPTCVDLIDGEDLTPRIGRQRFHVANVFDTKGTSCYPSEDVFVRVPGFDADRSEIEVRPGHCNDEMAGVIDEISRVFDRLSLPAVTR